MPESHFASSLVFWSAVSFGVLLFLLHKYAFPVIFRILEERQKKIRGSIDDAEKIRADAQTLLAEYEGKLKGAKQEVNAVLEEARLQARQILEEGREKMKRESQQMLEEARMGIQRERQDAMRDIQEATVDLTLAASEKILERELTDSDHQRFVKEVIQEIAEAKKR